MPKGIRIDFLANVRDFLRGTDDVESALDDVSDSLTDVGKDGAKSAEKLERSFKDALDATSKASAAAGDDVGKHVKKGAHEASQGMDDFKENTKGNLKETAASFSSVEDALGGIQGLASEALEGFGPAGIAAGAVAAIGIGVVSSKLTEIAEKTNAAAEAAATLAVAYRDATPAERAQALADGFDEVAGKVGDARHAWEVWQSDAVTNAEAFSEAIDAGALSVLDLQHAFTSTDPAERMASSKRASADLQRQLDATAESWDNAAGGAFAGATAARKATGLTQEQTEAVKAAKKAIDEKAKADADAQKVLEAYASASGLTVDAYLAQEQAARSSADSVEAFGQSLEAIADPVDSFNTLLGDGAKKANVTIATMIKDLERKAAERGRFESNLRTLAAKGGAALVDELRAQGPAAAGAVTAALARGTGADVRKYATLHAREVGTSAGKGVAAGVAATDLGPSLQGAVNRAGKYVTPPQVPVELKPDTAQLKREIQKLEQTTVYVNLRGGKKPIGRAYP